MTASASFAAPALAARLEKLGIRSKLDLALHLPLRYEDETRLTALKDVRTGVPALVEAEVVDTDVKYRPRRTLVVKLTDGERDLWVRFLNFYPSQVKQFAEGKRVRLGRYFTSVSTTSASTNAGTPGRTSFKAVSLVSSS